jgi:pimeloyl-ACP methyl ester carboxylesterase
VVTELDLDLGDRRTLHVYDSGAADADADLAVFWHHGTPQLGAPPEPLVPAAAALGIRWVSYDRPGYGGSSRCPGRDIASAAADVSAIADALGIGRFASMGASGGGPHALACAALMPGRVVAAVCIAGLAPLDADGLDWFAGMAAAGEAELRASRSGRVALEDYLTSAEFDPQLFTPADHAALTGSWSWLGTISGQAMQGGMDGMVDDNLAYVSPWGFDPTNVSVPVLFLHGGDDRVVPKSHAQWLAHRLPSSELWLRPGDGHISVLQDGAAAMEWLARHRDNC